MEDVVGNICFTPIIAIDPYQTFAVAGEMAPRCKVIESITRSQNSLSSDAGAAVPVHQEN